MNKRRIIMVCLLGIVILLFLLGIKDIKDNNIKRQLDYLINTDETQIIFFERKGNAESNDFKRLLNNDLSEQGVTYTTIDITNASYDDLEYFKEKLHLSSDKFDVYIAAIKGSENLTLINYEDYDRTKFLLANKNLLKDSTLVLNEYYYKLGKEALNNGFLGEAKRNFDNCLEYLDTKELLNDKRFLLLDSDYG